MSEPILNIDRCQTRPFNDKDFDKMVEPKPGKRFLDFHVYATAKMMAYKEMYHHSERILIKNEGYTVGFATIKKITKENSWEMPMRRVQSMTFLNANERFWETHMAERFVYEEVPLIVLELEWDVVLGV